MCERNADERPPAQKNGDNYIDMKVIISGGKKCQNAERLSQNKYAKWPQKPKQKARVEGTKEAKWESVEMSTVMVI